ncbi:MAG: hypothetical protein ACPLZG_11320 [Thermoproteota archaeon]|jgi:hypothetical protein
MAEEQKDDPIVEELTRIENRLAKVESDIAWLKQLYKSLDYRVWFIVAGVIVTILITLLR